MDDTLPATTMEFESIVLSQGLDYRSPKIIAQPGSIVDCLNREIIDSLGLKRIDGFEPYDGRASPAQAQYYVASNTTYSGDVTSDFEPGTLLVTTGNTTTLFGVVVDSYVTDVTGGDDIHNVVYALINKIVTPENGDTIRPYGTTTDFVATTISVLSESDAAETVGTMNTLAAALRGRIDSLPNVPIGLHWFRDRLFAVCNDYVMNFTSGGTTEIEPNNFLQGNSSGAKARVLAVDLVSGTWAGGDAAGSIQYEYLTPDTPFANGETLSYDNEVSLATPISADVATYSSSTTTDLDFASFWQSRSEQQAIDESASAGWSRIDHGWKFDYEQGFSDSGGFLRIKRSVDNNFTFETGSEEQFPVSIFNGSNISGTSLSAQTKGSTLTSNKVTLGNSGWKTGASSTDWATTEELMYAVDALDAEYAYANLFFSAYSNNSPYAAGTLVISADSIYGPTSGYLGLPAQPSNVGTETFDSDFLTTNMRAPLVLNDFSAVASKIPEGSLIVGVKVEIPDYDVQSYIFGNFQEDRNGTGGANIVSNTVAFLQDAFSWNACLCRSSTSTSASILGDVQTAAMAFPTTGYQSSISTAGGTDSFRMAATLETQSATIGGETNAFGLDSFSREDLLDTDLSLAIFGSANAAPEYPIGMISYSTGGTSTLNEQLDGTIRVKLYQIKVTFYYTSPSARYYVGEATPGPVCSVDVVYYVNVDGTFSSRTAKGSMFINNLTPTASNKRTIRATDKLYLTQADAAAGTNSIAVVSSDMEYAGLPGLASINAATSRYQFITANFYAVDDWDGIYGVSGAGKAFTLSIFDAGTGTETAYVSPIYTNVGSEQLIAQDKPRHIAYYHNALALGLRNGTLRVSVSGDPINFDGVDGSVEVGFGDRITGLLPLTGTTLGVFCENSIHGLNGTDPQSFDPQLLVPKSGAIEYTVVDMGMPVFCSSNGISTLAQSQQQGNYIGRRLSYPVTTWVLPRMFNSQSLVSATDGSGVVCAIPVRAKNQYRVVFRDGYILNMTMNFDQSPSFTFMRYYLGQDSDTETDKYLVPIAWSTDSDNTGKERIHISHYSTFSSVSSNFVYELERGWGFAGKYIPEYYTVNWYYKDPFAEKNVRKIRIDGLTKGVGSSVVNTAKDYELNFNTVAASISMPAEPFSTLKEDFTPASRLTHIAERGRSVSFKISGTYLTNINNPVPPDTHQVLLLQYPAGGRIDG